ncbi:MAG: uracil-DNA glycosylase [Planctomycetota bacterium]
MAERDDSPDPRAELRAITRAVHGLAELDRLMGVLAAPCPPLAAPPQGAGGAATRTRSVEPDPVPAFARRGAAPAGRPAARSSPAPAHPATPKPASPAPAARSAAPAARSAPPAAAPTARAELPRAAEPLAQRRARNELALHGLADRLSGCTRCRLHEARTNIVFGQGDAAAELVFVGEGPGYHEDMQGLAFVGPSGALLTKMINAMGYRREEVFICNVVKCRPPRNRSPQPDEMGTCLPFLREQLEIIRPRAICALGRTAATGLGLIGVDETLGRHRGRLVDWSLSAGQAIPTVLTYHPAYLLRSPQEKGKTWKDLQLLFPLLERRSPERIEE